MKPAWQRSSTEPALAPDIAIIDAHHHFWDSGHMVERFGRFAPEDVATAIATSGHRIVATVYLECFWGYRADGPKALRCIGETERVAAAADEAAARGGAYPKLAAAIVSNADLLLGAAVGDVLDAHADAAPNRFRGVRHVTAADPDEPLAGDSRRGIMGDPRFREGMDQLAKRQLLFETWCVHTQADEFIALADAYRQTPIVLDHLMTPLRVGRFRDRDAEVFAAWKAGVSEAARRPNVVLKVGGLGMAGAGFDWIGAATPPNSEQIANAYRPYFEHALATFSPSRCIFESNFAVDGLAYSYGVIWNAFKRLAAGLSADEQRALFHDNAARTYGIR